jgi:hypothetical protein
MSFFLSVFSVRSVVNTPESEMESVSGAQIGFARSAFMHSGDSTVRIGLADACSLLRTAKKRKALLDPIEKGWK